MAAVLLWTLSAGLASACLCEWPDLDTALSRAEVVFEATVISREASDFAPFMQVATLWVETVWVGQVPKAVLIPEGTYVPKTLGYSVNSCSASFTSGKRYLVFANRKADGLLHTEACSGGSPFPNPPLLEPLKAKLGEGYAPLPFGEVLLTPTKSPALTEEPIPKDSQSGTEPTEDPDLEERRKRIRRASLLRLVAFIMLLSLPLSMLGRIMLAKDESDSGG